MIFSPGVKREIRSLQEDFERAGLDVDEVQQLNEDFNKLEEAMSPQEAMDVLGLTPEQASDAAVVKKAYRDASRKHHPDLGGEPEMMKKVNAAYETLSGGGDIGGIPMPKTDWEAMGRKYRGLAVFVKDYLKREVQVDAFLEYLKQWEPNLEVSVTEYPDKDVDSPHYAGLRVKFATSDGKRALKVDFSVTLSNIANVALGTDEIAIPMTITTSVYVDGKDQKIKQQRYTFASTKSVIVDPSEVFPKLRMKKIFSGEARKNSKFSRRDMMQALTNELGARFSGDEPYAHIPIGEDEDGNPLELVIYRVVFLRTGSWSSAGVWRRTGKFQISRMIQDTMRAITFPESYEMIEKLKSAQQEIMAADPGKRVDVAKAWINAQKKEYDNRKIESVDEASEVQSLVFDKDEFSKGGAKNWVRGHDFKASKVDEKPESYRLRQKPPSDFKRFRTKEFGKGVKAVIGFESQGGELKSESAEDNAFVYVEPEHVGSEIKKPEVLGELDVATPKVSFEDALKGWHEQIEGGMAAGKDPSDFPQDELEAGYWIEFEHTKDPMMAIEIATDHLTENETYYTELVAMELSSEKKKSLKTEETIPTSFKHVDLSWERGKGLAGIAVARRVREMVESPRLSTTGKDEFLTKENVAVAVKTVLDQEKSVIDVTQVMPRDKILKFDNGEYTKFDYSVEVAPENVEELVKDVEDLVGNIIGKQTTLGPRSHED